MTFHFSNMTCITSAEVRQMKNRIFIGLLRKPTGGPYPWQLLASVNDPNDLCSEIESDVPCTPHHINTSFCGNSRAQTPEILKANGWAKSAYILLRRQL